MQLSTDVRSRLRTDGATLGAYVSDASIFRRVPKAVFEPRTVADIRSALQVAREEKWPVTVRGGGTSVAGNAIGEGLVIDTSRHFNRILEIDPAARTARVEPGVICDQLRDAAAEHGLTYGPDPPPITGAPSAACSATTPADPTRCSGERRRTTWWN